MRGKLFAACCFTGLTVIPAAFGLAVEAIVVATSGQPLSILFEKSVYLAAPLALGGGGFCMSALICSFDMCFLGKSKQEPIVQTNPPAPTMVNIEMEALRNANNSRKNSYSADESVNKKLQNVSSEMEESVSNLQTVLIQPVQTSAVIFSGRPGSEPHLITAVETSQVENSLLKNDHLKVSTH